jgi:hypothetical protein
MTARDRAAEEAATRDEAESVAGHIGPSTNRKLNHVTEIVAAQLREGHLVRVGLSSNYVLVAVAAEHAGRIEVTLYNGARPQARPSMFFKPGDLVHLSPFPGWADLTWPRDTDH